MGELAINFYKTLYSSEGTEHMKEILSTVPVKVIPTMNEKLLAPFRESEVKEALF
jgi:hypothetical protein